MKKILIILIFGVLLCGCASYYKAGYTEGYIDGYAALQEQKSMNMQKNYLMKREVEQKNLAHEIEVIKNKNESEIEARQKKVYEKQIQIQSGKIKN